jgi:hypothetical protein
MGQPKVKGQGRAGQGKDRGRRGKLETSEKWPAFDRGVSLYKRRHLPHSRIDKCPCHLLPSPPPLPLLRACVATQQNVCASASHVGGNGHSTTPTALSHDL